MNKTAFIALAAAAAPRLFQISKRTWLAIGLGVAVMLGLMVWAVVAMLSWLFSNAGSALSQAPDAARKAQAQAEVFMPGVSKTLQDMVPGLSILTGDKKETAGEKGATGQTSSPKEEK